MNAEPFVSRILDDEGLIGDLEGDAAEKLIGWLVKRAEQIAAKAKSDAAARTDIESLCKRGREYAANAVKHPDPEAALDSLLAKEA